MNAVVKPQLLSGSTARAIVPTSIEEAHRMSKAIAMAGWAPRSYLRDSRNPAQGYDEAKIMVGIMHGLELGLTPIAALQSIAVINGSPSIWGDGALAIVQASGLLEDFAEEPIYENNKIIGYRCTAVRRNIKTPFVQVFTLNDAERAGLLTKQGPWQQYQARMLQMRARAWTLRNGFSDVLRGLSIAEEAQDFIAIDTRQAKTKPTTKVLEALDSFSDTGGDSETKAEHETPPEG